MLSQLRKRKTMKRILWTLIVLIIPPFCFWGITSALGKHQRGSASYAGKIFGKKISFDDYNESLEETKVQATLMYGQRLSEIAEMLNLERQAWERLVLLKEARRKGVRVGDDEVIRVIQGFPFFQSSGQFDSRAYEMILRQSLRVEPRQFEEVIRNSIIISKLREQAIKNAAVTDAEIKEAYQKENEKSKIGYILVSPEELKSGIKIDEETARKYYDQNKESFRVDEQADVEYLPFEFSDYLKGVKITDEQTQKYYADHKDRFESKEFKDVKEAITNNLAQKKAMDLALDAAEKADYALADKKKSLEEVAKEMSIPIKETGFFQRQGAIPQIGWFPEIQKTAFSLKAGERGALIKPKGGMGNGYYIIRLKEKKPPYVPEFAEAKDKIETILKNEEASKLALKQAQDLRKKIADLMSEKNIKFEEAAGLAVKYSEPFTRSGYIQGLGSAAEMGEAAFKTPAGEASEVIKARAGYAILTVVEITPVDEKKFSEEKEAFGKKTLEAKKSKTLNDWFLKLIDESKLEMNTPVNNEGGSSPAREPVEAPETY